MIRVMVHDSVAFTTGFLLWYRGGRSSGTMHNTAFVLRCGGEMSMTALPS